jgi:hypothetical protein
VPFFATLRVNLTSPASMTQQTDTPNARDLQVVPNAETEYFCSLTYHGLTRGMTCRKGFAFAECIVKGLRLLAR